MASSINIGQLTVNSLTNNSNINSGATTHNSHNSNNNIIGGNFIFGDGCTSTFTNINSGNIMVPKDDSGQDS